MRALIILGLIAFVVAAYVVYDEPGGDVGRTAAPLTHKPFRNSIAQAQYDTYSSRYGMNIRDLEAVLGYPSGRHESAQGCTYQGCKTIKEWLYYNDVHDTYETDSYCFYFESDKLAEDLACGEHR